MVRLDGQQRLVAGMDRAVHAGWDMTAALALGCALGLPDWLIAEVLPDIEAVAMHGLNNREDENG